MYDVRHTIDVRLTKYDVPVRPTTNDGRHGTHDIRQEIYDLSHTMYYIRYTAYVVRVIQRTTYGNDVRYYMYMYDTRYEWYDVRHTMYDVGIRRTTKPDGPLFVVDQYNFI